MLNFLRDLISTIEVFLLNNGDSGYVKAVTSLFFLAEDFSLGSSVVSLIFGRIISSSECFLYGIWRLFFLKEILFLVKCLISSVHLY
jgi:hypothetical protein